MVPYAQKIKDKLEGQGILNIIIVSKNKEIENLNILRPTLMSVSNKKSTSKVRI